MTLNDDVEAPERQRSGDYEVTRFNALRHVALVQARGLVREAVDDAPAFHGRPIREIAPVVGPEVQQNPSDPVISESYQGLGMF